MEESLSGSGPEMTQYTREKVRAVVAQDFPCEDPAVIMEVLDLYGTEPYQLERERVQLAVLLMSAGDIEKVRTLIAMARRDYRDVLQ